MDKNKWILKQKGFSTNINMVLTEKEWNNWVVIF